MAYITTEEVKEKRDAIKKAFPKKDGWKFSIKRSSYSGISIKILEAPVNFLSKYKNGDMIRPSENDHKYLQQIYSIANSGNYDRSDTMTDYFDIGFYVWLYIGSWDKDFKIIKK